MNFGDKLAALRRRDNLTQEQLADILGVSRQSISKWESGLAYPETDKLIRIGELFSCSMDYLLKDDCTDVNGADTGNKKEVVVNFSLKNLYFERKSARTIFGMPLWHVNIGFGRTAKGFFAFGIKSVGVVSFGILSAGIVSFGVLALGLLSFGAFSLGLLSLGAIAVGVIALGAVAIGLLSFGALAVGQFAVGAAAFGNYFAYGDYASAMIAVGETDVFGEVLAVHFVTDSNRSMLIEALESSVPAFWVAFKNVALAIIS